MALSNKERQANYRDRKRREKETGYTPSKRNTLEISDGLAQKLENMAKFEGITETELVERLINEAELNLLQDIWKDKDAKNRYFGW